MLAGTKKQTEVCSFVAGKAINLGGMCRDLEKIHPRPDVLIIPHLAVCPIPSPHTWYLTRQLLDAGREARE